MNLLLTAPKARAAEQYEHAARAFKGLAADTCRRVDALARDLSVAMDTADGEARRSFAARREAQRSVVMLAEKDG